uniref:Uncharacterized protein n=1 Tax=Anguilla anguilla TaxID=7936 RepID=A0A0E9SY30_ANGAN
MFDVNRRKLAKTGCPSWSIGKAAVYIELQLAMPWT